MKHKIFINSLICILWLVLKCSVAAAEHKFLVFPRNSQLATRNNLLILFKRSFPAGFGEEIDDGFKEILYFMPEVGVLVITGRSIVRPILL